MADGMCDVCGETVEECIRMRDGQMIRDWQREALDLVSRFDRELGSLTPEQRAELELRVRMHADMDGPVMTPEITPLRYVREELEAIKKGKQPLFG